MPSACAVGECRTGRTSSCRKAPVEGDESAVELHNPYCTYPEGALQSYPRSSETPMTCEQPGGSPVCGYSWDGSGDRNSHLSAPPKDISAISFPAQSPFSAGLLTHFSRLLDKAYEEGSVRYAALCTPQVLHCRSKRGFGFTGDITWGCGYRNAQMLFSAARHCQVYRTMLLTSEEVEKHQDLADIPNIRQMQEIVEGAWKEGSDPSGSEHFGGKIVGRRKWIGATEVYVLLTTLGLRATIVDFPEATGLKGTHASLIRWIREYFGVYTSPEASTPVSGKQSISEAQTLTPGSPIRQTTRLPLYLQHQGHSRTIVGVEICRDGDTQLLVFDPAKSISPALKPATAQPPQSASREMNPAKKTKSTLGIKSKLEKIQPFPGSSKAMPLNLNDHAKLLSPYRVSLKSLSRQAQYQVLYIDAEGPALTLEEQARRKTICSITIK